MGIIIESEDGTMITLNLYFNDLTVEAQFLYLDFQGFKTAKEANLDLDVMPIHSLTRCKLHTKLPGVDGDET